MDTEIEKVTEEVAKAAKLNALTATKDALDAAALILDNLQVKLLAELSDDNE